MIAPLSHSPSPSLSLSLSFSCSQALPFSLSPSQSRVSERESRRAGERSCVSEWESDIVIRTSLFCPRESGRAEEDSYQETLIYTGESERAGR